MFFMLPHASPGPVHADESSNQGQHAWCVCVGGGEAGCPREPVQGMWNLLSCIQSIVLSQKVSAEAFLLLTFLSL